MRRSRMLWMVIASIVLGVLGRPASAWAHAKLLRAQPASGSTVKTVPTVVRAWFSEELDPKTSILSVWDSRGRRVDDGKGGVDLNDLDRKSMIAAVKLTGPGVYTVKWKAVSADDRFAATGSFRFTVAAPGR